MRTPQQSWRDQLQHGQAQHRHAQHASSRPAADQPLVRHAAVDSAPRTPAERASLRAIAAMNRAATQRPGVPLPGRSRPGSGHRAKPGQNSRGQHGASRTGARPPALRRTTGIVLTAAGAILWLAVHARVLFVSTQPAGLVLLVTGLLWLWIPVPAKRERLQRRFDQLMTYLEPAQDVEARCSLDDLLKAPSRDSAPTSPGGGQAR